MWDCDLRLTREDMKPTKAIPTVGVTRVESQGTIHEPERRMDVLAEIAEQEARISQHHGVVSTRLKRLPGQSHSMPPVNREIVGPIVEGDCEVAHSRQGERRSITWITRDRLLEEAERSHHALPLKGIPLLSGLQIQVIGSHIAGRPVCGEAGLGRLQCRLDNADDAQRNIVLQIEYVFGRTVEVVSPKMRPANRVDQLCGDAHPVSILSHRAFEHIADAKLPADLLYTDRFALVRKARIARDDKQPTDARQRSNDLFDDPIGEVLLLLVAAHILERQHGDRRLVWKRQGRG